jgi:hypothetical protein
MELRKVLRGQLEREAAASQSVGARAGKPEWLEAA